MKISPMAGKLAPAALLVNVPRLVTAYYTDVPDPSVPGQRVAFGTSGHRGSSFERSFNEWHVLAVSQAICEYRAQQGINGPLFLGVDTHALSIPACASAVEVLAANDVEVMLAEHDEYTPTPAISLAILTHNRGRTAGFADGIVITPSHNPPDNGGFKYNPPNSGPADTVVTGWIEAKANDLLETGLKGVKRMTFARALRATTTHRYDYLKAYVNALDQIIDMAAIRGENTTLGVDPMGGAGVHYWGVISQRYGLYLKLVSDEVDPTFRFMTVDWDGCIRMDPSSSYAMQRLIDLKDHYDIAFTCDTDHDRHGIVTPGAGLLPPNHSDMSRKPLTTEAELDRLQREAFSYFIHETNPANGLVIDKSAPGWPASIAAVGLALAAYPVAVERGFITRTAAVKRVAATLRFFWNSSQGPEPDATGYRGFYYHFLDMQTGKRAWKSELSTIDSSFLLAGALTAGRYFAAATAAENEIRTLADALYRRADWPWAQAGGAAVSLGWKPETGFLPYRWKGYDEALLLYILGLGSPSNPLPKGSYEVWASAYQWERSYGYDYLYAGPLFTHQLSHIWVDFRGIQDGFMRAKGIDYFENSRRATLVQQQYAIDNPHGFTRYGACCWGITASDGPGPATLEVNGIKREFFDYVARGVPHGLDDGTLAPWVVVASLPFAPEIVLPTIDYFVHQIGLKSGHPYGFKATFNPTYPDQSHNPYGWVSPWHFGINQGPIILMVENYRSELPWRLMRDCPYIADGLRRADFTGGWLSIL